MLKEYMDQQYLRMGTPKALGPRPNRAQRNNTGLSSLRGPNPTPNPVIPRKRPRLHELYRKKIRANFCLLPCDMSQELSRHCSEKRVRMNLFDSGWILCGVESPFLMIINVWVEPTLWLPDTLQSPWGASQKIQLLGWDSSHGRAKIKN